MRKYLAIALAALCMAGCKKDPLPIGTFTGSITGKVVNVELLPGGNTVMYFSGGEEDTGYYGISGDEIYILNTIHSGSGYSRHTYRFTSAVKGKIYNADSFSAYYEKDGEDPQPCSFTRRR